MFGAPVEGLIRSAFGSGFGTNLAIGITRQHSGIAASSATAVPFFSLPALFQPSLQEPRLA
jgi:hypothetical protein